MNQQNAHPVRRRIITILGILLAVILIFLLRRSTQVTFYKDPYTTGNSSTNLLNGGLFASLGDRIYFANPADQNALYSMNPDGSDIKKIYEDNVSYLNAAGKYIFYTRRNDKKGKSGNAILSLSTTGLYRISSKGTGLKQLFSDPTQTVTLYGNDVFYQHYDKKKGLQLFKIGIDGKNDTMLLDEGVSPSVILDDKIFYIGADSDHNIHTMNTDGSGKQVLLEGNYTGLSYCNGYLYFMDMAKDYALCRAKTDGSALTTLVNTRIATYNISPDSDTVYYQQDDGKENGLYAMIASSGSTHKLKDGNYNYLHIISDTLYFEDFDGSNAYRMDLTSGEINPLNLTKK